MSHRAIAFAFALLTAASVDSAERPFSELPYTPSLDLNAMDRTVDPCEDLYTYSCGGWQRRNPIPADQSSWSVYRKLHADTQQYVWGLLEEAAKSTANRSPTRQRVGDYFAACMEEAAIDARGLKPIEPLLSQIAGIKSTAELPALLARLHSSFFSSGLFFDTGAEQDAREATKVITAVHAGGIGLPDRDYYLKDDQRSRDIRTRYRQHVKKMLELAGSTTAQAERQASTVMRIETALAKASLTRVEQRDPYNIYHRTTVSELQKTTTKFDWSTYFAKLGFSPEPWLNNAEPKFLLEVDRVLGAEPIEDIKAYLRWGVLDAQASYLSRAFADEDFAFNSAYLRGVPEQRPRWKRCVSWVDRDLGEALGREFVERSFPAGIKQQTLQMTNQIQSAMKQRIEQLDWMSPDTKRQALAKLDKMRNKIGYPESWRDYSALTISRDDFYGNMSRSMSFEIKRQAAKVGQPVDRNEWLMTPVTVNAYYDPAKNDMNFPAAVLLPPLFDPKLDDAPNYGNTGGTIGHELTHGFDDEGRQFDGDGNLHDWWQKSDAEEFEGRAQCVRNQYAQYTVIDDIKVNSELSAGEDIADLGGLILAWIAWQEQTKAQRLRPQDGQRLQSQDGQRLQSQDGQRLQSQDGQRLQPQDGQQLQSQDGQRLQSQDGLTPAQRFFVGFAQWDCANERPEHVRLNAVVNPHSPPKYRINGVVVNMPEFTQAFQCKAGQALVKKPEEVCRIW
jgi:putative endopeptidase